MQTIEIPPERAKVLFLYLDGLHYACSVCALSFERALSTLQSFESENGEKLSVSARLASSVIADVWNVVDSAFRCRILAAKTPYLRRVTPEYEIFERQTRNVETLRHYVQHLDNNILSRTNVSTPVWGSISWQSKSQPNTALTLIAGTPAVSQSHYSLVWDRLENKFVRPVELVVGDTILDVAGTVESVARLNRALKAWSDTFKFRETGSYLYEPDFVPVFKVLVSPKPR